MNSIDLETLLVTVFVMVDDWYQKAVPPRSHLPAVKPQLSDSEILTLALIMDYLPFPGETQFLSFMEANYRCWFPNLLEQSQFNRRLRRLEAKLEALRRSWVKQLGVLEQANFLIDTKPLPVVGYRRSKRHSDFSGSANSGDCSARKLKYFGYKLVMLCTLSGLPIAYDLVPANTDERQAVGVVLSQVSASDVYGDKGFIGQDWQEQIHRSTGNRIWTIHRSNQHHPPSPSWKRLISCLRQRIEVRP